MKNNASLASRLKKVRKDQGLTQEDAAEYVGVSLSTYRNYESGRSTPQHATEEEVIDAVKKRQHLTSPGVKEEGDPLYDVTASLGDGSYEVSEREIGRITGEQAMSRPGRRIFWVLVRGDSMGERYRKHSMVPCLRFKKGLKDIQEDDVYLFRLEGAVQIKRLQRLSGHRIRIISDNDAYPDEILQLDDGIDFEVIGRVMI